MTDNPEFGRGAAAEGVGRAPHVSTLVGGVAQLYQGDLDLGRRAADRLASEELGSDVRVEDLHYGGVAVAQQLQDLRPEALVLVGASCRGREPGAVERRRVRDPGLPPEELRRAVEEAATGYVAIDLIIEVGAGLGALPDRTVAIEVEPVRTEIAESLSPEAENGLEAALEIARIEVQRLPMLRLADRMRRISEDGHLESAPALDTLHALMVELDTLDESGRWGATFALRDELRRHIQEGRTSEGMSHLDWGLWWALIEELDRLQTLEAGA